MPPVQPPQIPQPMGTGNGMGMNPTMQGVPGASGAMNVPGTAGMPEMQGTPGIPGAPGMPGMPGMQPPFTLADGSTPAPTGKPHGVHMSSKTANLIKIIAIVILSLISVAFIGLFIWMYVKYDELDTTFTQQVDIAVAEAKDEQATQMEAEFLQREKYPYQIFSGPADYGQLTFEYPKTWSVYVEKAADKGGDYQAYFNPVQVDAVGKDTINALRVTVSTKSYDTVVEEYQRALDRKDSQLNVESIEIGNAEKGITTTANRYTGNIPNTELNGYIVIFKLRDKTVILQTDSVLFQEDFDKLLGTIVYNA